MKLSLHSFSSPLEAAEQIDAENRQWIHLIPSKRFSGRDGRGPYSLNQPSTVLDRTRQYHGSKQMVVDYEHQSVNASKNGKPAPAAGWAEEFQARADGIWALVRWTAEAAEMIRKRQYRYISPVFSHTKDGEITLLHNAGLTNSPNLELTPVAHSEDISMDESQLIELRTLLALPDDAEFAAILKAIGDLLAAQAHTAKPDPAQYVPIAEYERAVTEVHRLNKGISAQHAETVVTDHIKAGRMFPYMKDWAISLCTVNAPAFEAFIERTKAVVEDHFRPQFDPARHRRLRNDGQKLSEEERTVCHTLGLSEDEFIKGRVADYEQD